VAAPAAAWSVTAESPMSVANAAAEPDATVVPAPGKSCVASVAPWKTPGDPWAMLDPTFKAGMPTALAPLGEAPEGVATEATTGTVSGVGGVELPLTGMEAPLVPPAAASFEAVALRAGLAPACCSAMANVELVAPELAEIGAADAPAAELTSEMAGA
jgi:hypothetical protein